MTDSGPRFRFEASVDFERSDRAMPMWPDSLPPVLRIAAELHFGAMILFAIIGAVRYGPGAGAGGLFAAALGWMQTHFRGRGRPGIWWINVVMFTIMGIFFSALMEFG